MHSVRRNARARSRRAFGQNLLAAVAGNIPYALTAAVVRWCLTAPTLRSATLLTQWEDARRYGTRRAPAGPPGSARTLPVGEVWPEQWLILAQILGQIDDRPATYPRRRPRGRR